ncbi:MAG: EVE domain-containing protein [Anaerolineae bacterium]|nr:EVE domain-containing protein [Anaerolineae bacterium]
MGAHILLASEKNFEMCIARGIYGCVRPTREWTEAEVVSGILSIQPDDLVFFYVKNKGIYGVWKVVGVPYFDETRIWADSQRVFPYRFSFEPTVGYFPKPVALSDVFDLRDKGLIWTFDLNPVQRKNQYKITMNEARELLRLLLRNNPIRQAAIPLTDPYIPSKRGSIEVDLSSDTDRQVKYEGWLNAWFMRAFAGNQLKDLLGDYREFLNLVPTTFNKVMDIFLTHVATVGSIEVTYKYTCIELKTDRATETDLTQILHYEDWLARKLASGDHEMIQSVLVARHFSKTVVEYVRNRQLIEEKTVRLISYCVTEDGVSIKLEEFV